MNGNANSTALVYGLLVLTGIASGVGDILLYRWAWTAHTSWLTLALALWVGSVLLLGVLFRLEYFSFGAAVLLATLAHLSISLCWSWLFTEYPFNRWEAAGLFLALFAVICLEAGRASVQAP